MSQVSAELKAWIHDNARDVYAVLERFSKDPVAWSVEIVQNRFSELITTENHVAFVRGEETQRESFKRAQELVDVFLDSAELAICHRCLSPVLVFQGRAFLTWPPDETWHDRHCDSSKYVLGNYGVTGWGSAPVASRSERGGPEAPEAEAAPEEFKSRRGARL